ncbi:unnamed protein product [Fusarium graminearum]|nr:unnamed protein product [Fusarium graminearum]
MAKGAQGEVVAEEKFEGIPNPRYLVRIASVTLSVSIELSDMMYGIRYCIDSKIRFDGMGIMDS